MIPNKFKLTAACAFALAATFAWAKAAPDEIAKLGDVLWAIGDEDEAVDSAHMHPRHAH